ncbi:MAG: hypothetical protein ACLPUG_07750 [Acidimicrobiales bacterium]
MPASVITSVLLLCDAWFDLFTANGHCQLVVSTKGDDLCPVEIPLARARP